MILITDTIRVVLIEVDDEVLLSLIPMRVLWEIILMEVIGGAHRRTQCMGVLRSRSRVSLFREAARHTVYLYFYLERSTDLNMQAK